MRRRYDHACEECGKAFRGRKDQRFCCRHCQGKHNKREWAKRNQEKCRAYRRKSDAKPDVPMSFCSGIIVSEGYAPRMKAAIMKRRKAAYRRMFSHPSNECRGHVPVASHAGTFKQSSSLKIGI